MASSSAAAVRTTDRVKEKRRKRRNQILHAALTAFRERGFHQTTLDDIADHLGLRKTALYHYFPDKESLLYELHRESLAELERILKEARKRFITAGERLRFIVCEHVRVMTETLEGSPLAMDVTSLSREHQEEIISGRDRYERGLRRIIVRGIRNGEFREVEPKLAVFAILGAINWIARWFHPEGTIDPGELGEEYADYLVGGLECH